MSYLEGLARAILEGRVHIDIQQWGYSNGQPSYDARIYVDEAKETENA